SASHPSRKKEWERILYGYRKAFPKAAEVITQMNAVEARIRYAEGKM
ncbi:MAG: hypothetical protein HY917_01300, partial [Candidatus Diapherotrites archaeon]|nr:hypothetical protein [Candidatus Diapherotrites archaeon]